MCLCAFYEKNKQIGKKLDLLNEGRISLPSCVPIAIEQMLGLIAVSEWDQVYENCQKIVESEKRCIPALSAV